MRKSVRCHGIDAALALLVFGTSLAVYHATLTPSLSYKSPDGNELATIPYVLGLAHATGYPLYTWLGKLFTFLPVGDVAHRVNLMSAVLGAAGVGLLYCVLRLLLGRGWRGRLAAGFAALLFAFSRTFWSQTGIAEVYASNLFMLALTLLLILLWARAEERDRARRPVGGAGRHNLIPGWRPALLLFLAALSLGLSLGTHMSSLGFAPAMALFVLLVSWPTALSPAGWAAGGSGLILGALQFLWLPFKAGTLNDPLMMRNAPDTWRAFYDYTLGAFPQFKFAFGWDQVPDRIVIYLAMLVGQYGLVGTLVGLLGMWVALFRWPKRFFLLMGMYLVHVVFFTQYAVFDLDVFFIPAHFLFAVFVGCGLWQVLEWLAAGGRWVLGRIRSRRGSSLVRAGLIALAVLVLGRGIGREVRANWEHNDYSEDVAINDFYENVFLVLPDDSVLLGRGGVFGYDMFYYRLVYEVRPDVLLPHIDGMDLQALELEGRPVFTNERPQPGRRNPWSLPADLLPADSWIVPVLLGPTPERHGLGGGRAELTLWQVTDEPPELVVPAGRTAPQNQVTIPLSGKTLVGYDLEAEGGEVGAGRAVHLTLYWQIERADNRRVSLTLDGESLLSYEVGFGNLSRYAEEFGLTGAEGQLVVDDFWLVIPRTTDAGPAVLGVGDALPLNPWLGPQDSAPSTDLTELMIGEAAPLLNWE